MAAAFSQFIFDEAELFDVPPDIVAGIILVESSGEQNAFRWEQGFFDRYLNGKSRERLGGHWPDTQTTDIFEEQERTLRACSFGLMQVLGQVAREFGFSHNNLFDLYDPKINIHFGVMKFAAEVARAKERKVTDPITTALLKYNGGGEPRYPEKVLSKIKTGLAGQLLHDS